MLFMSFKKTIILQIEKLQKNILNAFVDLIKKF